MHDYPLESTVIEHKKELFQDTKKPPFRGVVGGGGVSLGVAQSATR